MIKSKRDLQFYLLADQFILGRTRKRPSLNDEVWRYQILLRKAEYLSNQPSSIYTKIKLKYLRFRKLRLGLKLGFDIPENVFDAGLRINHFGSLIVNPKARIGRWCDIHQGVVIGSNNSEEGTPLVPIIGSNVWIGPGAKLFGNITIGNDVQIGANSVVNNSFTENVTVGGVPAKVIATKGTTGIKVAASKVNASEFFQIHPEFCDYNSELDQYKV